MYEMSMNVDEGGSASSVLAGAASVQSVVFFAANSGTGGPVLVTPLTDIFIRQGVNPVALATGVDSIMLGGQTYRVHVAAGNRLAVIQVSAGGNVYFDPWAKHHEHRQLSQIVNSWHREEARGCASSCVEFEFCCRRASGECDFLPRK